MTHSPPSADPLESSFQAAFADVIEPRPGDDARLDAMVAQATSVAAPPAATGASGSSGASGSLTKILVGIGVGVGVVGLAVALWPAAPAPTSPRTAPPQPSVQAQAPAPAASAVVPEEAPDLDEATATPRATAESVDVVEPADVAPTEPTPAEPATRARAARPAPEAAAPTAGELLARANTARRDGSFAAADADFAELQRRHPGSREAVLARVTHGRLLLDELDRPKDALAQFSAYLDARPDGTLAEEAMVGRARALERLGRTADADAAWDALGKRFPDSVHAKH